MEDAKRKSKRVLRIERGFEWSRIEEHVMASAYEHVLPILRAGPAGLLAKQVRADSDGLNRRQRYATGA